MTLMYVRVRVQPGEKKESIELTQKDETHEEVPDDLKNDEETEGN